MSTQPLSHLRITETKNNTDTLDFTSAQSILKFTSDRIKIITSALHDNTPRRVTAALLSFNLIVITLSIPAYSHTRSVEFIIAIIISAFSSYLILFHSPMKSNLIKNRSIHSNLKNKRGEYFLLLLPLSREMQILQDTTNASHILVNSPELTSWQKVDLGIQIRNAEEALMIGREILEKYDPSLLPK